MTGLENISPGRNLQLIPYAAFSRSHFLDQPDFGVPAFRGKTEFRPGLDAKAVIHDTLTVDVALNPDFSQVESDDPAVTVNQRFEVFFPEKRPFFVENNSYFTTPENLFFSRRIVDPEFVNHLTRTRANYQFTRALSLRLIVDYNATLENASLIDLTRQKRITGDTLVTYLIHPGTALYVGYTDRLENLALTHGAVLPIGFPSTTTSRQFFAKVSYMFRF
jgi:hypothetical protein